jgi:hypothetical protein
MHGLFKFVGSRKPLGSALPGEQNIWAWATFTPDSRRLFAVYQSGRAFRWEVRPDAWSRKACEVAGRELTLKGAKTLFGPGIRVLTPFTLRGGYARSYERRPVRHH